MIPILITPFDFLYFKSYFFKLGLLSAPDEDIILKSLDLS